MTQAPQNPHSPTADKVASGTRASVLVSEGMEFCELQPPEPPDCTGPNTGDCGSYLRLRFDKTDSKLRVHVLEVSHVLAQHAAPPRLYDPPAAVSVGPSLSIDLGVAGWPEFDQVSLWVEASIRTHRHPDQGRQHTCQVVVEGQSCIGGSGECTRYDSFLNEELVFDLKMLARGIEAETADEERLDQDALDLYAKSSVHLVLVLHVGQTPVGELYFPLHTTKSHEAWYTLRPMNQSLSGKLRRTKRQGESRAWEEQTSLMQNDVPFWPLMARKVISLRALFILLIFIQLCFVIATTTIVLAVTANSELTRSAEVLSYSVQKKIHQELKSRLSRPKAYVVNTNAYLMLANDSLPGQDFLHFLGQNYADSRTQGLITSNNFYTGTPNNRVFGVGVKYAYFDVPLEQANNTSMYMTYTLDDPLSTLVQVYGWDTTCVPGNTSCDPSNLTDPISPRPNITVSSRPWYQKAINSDTAAWTDVYLYITGVLGITVASRTPLNLGLPVSCVSAADVTLGELNDLLGNLQYYNTGYGFLVGLESGYLIATSLNAPVSVNLQRVKAAESSFAKISNVVRDIQAIYPQDSSSPSSYLFNIPGMNATLITDTNIISVKAFDFLGIQDKWAVVIVIPQSDFKVMFRHMLLLSILCGLVLLTIFVIVTIMVVNRVTAQLISCTRQLTHFANLDFSTKVLQCGLDSPVKEIARIYQALQSMRLSLRSFYKYVPPEVVRMVVDSNQEARLYSQKKQLTILFSDVVNFTSIAEILTPEDLVELLGEYLHEMSLVVLGNEGVVDKYIGDAIMALWNAPDTIIDHPRKACEAALLSQTSLLFLQKEWLARGYPLLGARIGIHTGMAIVGNIGASHRLNYTAIGDSVNLAERLEGLNKNYGTKIMISEDTYYYVQKDFVCRPLDLVPAQRRSGCLVVYELIAHKTTATLPEVKSAMLFSKGFQLYLDRKFEAARAVFGQYSALYNSEDKACMMLCNACVLFIDHPPPLTWVGLRPEIDMERD